MTDKPTTTTEPADTGEVRIKLSGDMNDTGSDVLTIGGKPDEVHGDMAAAKKEKANG